MTKYPNITKYRLPPISRLLLVSLANLRATGAQPAQGQGSAFGPAALTRCIFLSI